MGSLKVRTLFFIVTLALGFVPRVGGMPSCGVCADPAAFRAQSTSSIPAVGEKKLLYIRICYVDEAAEPISLLAAESLMTEVSRFYHEHSYGQFAIAATVTALLTLPSPKEYYFPIYDGTQYWQPQYILDDALAAAREAGYDPAKFDFHMLRFNSLFTRSFASIGSGGAAWMASSHPATTIHELGHNLGLQHANQWSGPLNGPGTDVEYGDDFDIMGNPPEYQIAGFHFLHKRALGWLTESNAMRVAASGVYRVHAHDTATNDLARTYALRIRKDEERDYWIEKREGFGEVYDHMLRSGVLTYWNEWSGSAGRTQILDLLGTNESLPVGTAMSDPEAGVKVIPVEQAADLSWMDVAVVFGLSKIDLLGDWLHFSGEPNQAYSIQSSTDLGAWSEVARLSSASGELITKIDRGAARAFYRVVAAGVNSQ